MKIKTLAAIMLSGLVLLLGACSTANNAADNDRGNNNGKHINSDEYFFKNA